jgi:hypothetical protein
MRKWLVAVLLAVGMVSFGCGGGSSTSKTTNGTPPPPSSGSLTVQPSSATVALGKARAFTVHVTSGTAPSVTWSVNGVNGGNSSVGKISTSGLYTAPATFPSNPKMTITATASSGAHGNATANIVYPNDTTDAENRPVALGTSGGNNNDLSGNTCCSGTLGALVSRGGNLYILSANHVLDKSDEGAVGDPIGQPGLVDTNCSGGAVVAHMSQAANLQTSNVDAAIARIVSGDVRTDGAILDLGAAGSTSIAAAPPSATLAHPADVLSANEGVAKSGRSTGLTCSNVSSVNTSVQVDYDKSCGGVKAFTATFTNQVVINGATFSSGGDSGALIVTSDSARPLGLLYAGSDTDTVANPIQDVLAALQDSTTKEAPAIVGGGDHAVSCEPTAVIQSAQATAGAASAILSPDELGRGKAVKEKWEADLMSDPAVTGVGVGRSTDDPSQAAIVVYTSGKVSRPIPPLLDGVRTQVVAGSRFAARSGPASEAAPAQRMERAELQRGLGAKEMHVSELLAQQGIVGVGVGKSDDAPGESAVVIYVEKGVPHAAIAPVLDGVRTKVVETKRFKAFGWNHDKEPQVPACTPKAKRAVLQPDATSAFAR